MRKDSFRHTTFSTLENGGCLCLDSSDGVPIAAEDPLSLNPSQSCWHLTSKDLSTLTALHQCCLVKTLTMPMGEYLPSG